MHRSVPRANSRLAITATSAVAVTAAIAATLVAGGGPAGATTEPTFAYGANAFGSHVTLGTLANVGKTALTPMCTTKVGTAKTNKTAKVDLGAVGYIGAVTSATASTHPGDTEQSSAATHTAYTSLLTGVIKLSAVTTNASVTHDASGFTYAGHSTFAGLRIGGMSFPADPTANSTYTLPGLGSLTLNEQHAGKHYGIPTMSVTALDLVLGSANELGLPAGHIVIGQSTASLLQTNRVPSGSAFATNVSVASVVGSGRTAAAYTGCGGTGSAGHSNDLAGVAIPGGVATVGGAKSTVHTRDSAAKSTSTSTNTIADLSLLNGMIKAKALTTRAYAASTGGRHTSNSDSTSVLGLVIDGTPVQAPQAGQSQSIPGLGELTFGYAQKTKTGIVVYGLRLVLGTATSGLPAGAVLTVGAAKAAVAG